MYTKSLKFTNGLKTRVIKPCNLAWQAYMLSIMCMYYWCTYMFSTFRHMLEVVFDLVYMYIVYL